MHLPIWEAIQVRDKWDGAHNAWITSSLALHDRPEPTSPQVPNCRPITSPHSQSNNQATGLRALLCVNHGVHPYNACQDKIIKPARLPPKLTRTGVPHEDRIRSTSWRCTIVVFHVTQHFFSGTCTCDEEETLYCTEVNCYTVLCLALADQKGYCQWIAPGGHDKNYLIAPTISVNCRFFQAIDNVSTRYKKRTRTRHSTD